MLDYISLTSITLVLNFFTGYTQIVFKNFHNDILNLKFKQKQKVLLASKEHLNFFLKISHPTLTYVAMCMCACVCLIKRMCVHVYAYTYVCACVCVRVCICACVCMYMLASYHENS